MNLFKTFFLLIKKNLSIILMYIMIFSVLTLVLGTVYGSNDEFFQEETYSIAYIDEDNSALTRGIIEYLSIANELEDVSNRDDSSIQDLIFFRIYSHELVFKKGFEEKILNDQDVQVDYEATLPMGVQAFMVRSQVEEFITTYKSYISMGYDDTIASERTIELLSRHTEVSIAKSHSDTKINENSTIFVGNQYLWYALFSSICFSAGVVILSGMQDTLSMRIEASPVSRSKRNLINFIGVTIMGLIMYGVFVIAQFIIGRGSSNWIEYKWIYIINGLLATLTVTSLVSFITSFKIKPTSINMISNILSLGFAFIGGEFVPQYVLGPEVLSVAKFTPTYWFVYVNNMTHSMGMVTYDMGEVKKAFLIQGIFILVFIVGSQAVGRIRTSLKT